MEKKNKLKKLFLIFNHTLTEEQIFDAKENLKVTEILSLPEELQKQWSNFPPDTEETDTSAIENWLSENSEKNDWVLVQGDFGATYKLVNFAFSRKLIPVYATTKRVTLEKISPDGEIEKTSVFKHVRFRKF